MKRHSRTADAVAAIRAAHYLHGSRPYVLEDSLAIRLLSPVWKLFVGNPALYHLITRGPYRTTAGVFGNIIGRSRFAEDCLWDGMSAGIRQYIVLGAGFDSFAYRHPTLASTVRVFEIDHPVTQKTKLDRLTASEITIGENVTYIPMDFTVDSIQATLADSRYGIDLSQPVLISWLGVVCYLERSLLERQLRALGTTCARGSRIAFDFLDSDIFKGRACPALKHAMDFARRRGERIITGFTPDELNELVVRLGWRVVRVLTPPQQDVVYFSNRPDGLTATDQAHLALIEC